METKQLIISSLEKCYMNSNWFAFINTILPLIDFVVRHWLKADNLTVGVKNIIRLFEENGFTVHNLDELMPHITAVKSFTAKSYMEWTEWVTKMQEFDFGILGPALNSFIKFANIYYGNLYNTNKSGNVHLNRHAILHGEQNAYGTKVNSIKETVILTVSYIKKR